MILADSVARGKVPIRSLSLKVDNEYAFIQFELTDAQQGSIWLNNNSKVVRPRWSIYPDEIRQAIEKHRTELNDLKTRLNAKNGPNNDEYRHMCKLFEIQPHEEKHREGKPGETEGEATQRKVFNDAAKKEFKSEQMKQLLSLFEPSTFIGVPTMFRSGFDGAKLEGTLYFVIDARLDSNQGVEKGIAVKMAVFDDQIIDEELPK